MAYGSYLLNNLPTIPRENENPKVTLIAAIGTIHVKEYGYLLKLLVYTNCNYEIHDLGKAKDWPWSSYLDSIGLRKGTLCNLKIIKEEFGNLDEFKNFCDEIIPEIKVSKELKKYLLE